MWEYILCTKYIAVKILKELKIINVMVVNQSVGQTPKCKGRERSKPEVDNHIVIITIVRSK